MNKFNLIAGMPRSGSTLLCNLLNMNPEVHATATSPVMDVISNMRSTFSHNPTFKTNDRLIQYDNMCNGIKGFLGGFYHDKNIVFDKSRGWVSHLMLLDAILGHNQTKVIWTYRNPVDVFSSIEKRHRKTILLENVDEGSGMSFATLENRVDNFIGDNGIITRPVWLLSDAYDMGYSSRILFVKYWDITNNTQKVLDAIHNFIGEESYQYDVNNFSDLKQTTKEFDGLYNYKFSHDIKEGEVKYVENKLILPAHIKEKINHRFSWLNDIAKNSRI